jgi:hypothetical protein
VKSPRGADITTRSTLSFKVVLKVPRLSSIGNGCIVDYKNPFGNTFDTATYRGSLFQLCVNSSKQTTALVVTGGSSERWVSATSTDTGFTAGTVHEMILQMDGSYVTAFRDGIPVIRRALTQQIAHATGIR